MKSTKKNGFSPATKTVIMAPPTEEMRKAALKVLKRRAEDEQMFIDEVRMLGLDDLIAV